MTSQYRPGLLKRLVYSYKSIRLPWRRSLFRGYDLDGNTFWETYNPLTPHKYRRTVKYLVDGHYTDNSVTPQWMSWLRHTRPNPPTLEELQSEVYRIQSTRQNAALVQQRWAEERDRLLQNKTEKDGIEAPQAAAQETTSTNTTIEQQETREAKMRESTQQSQAQAAKQQTSQNDYLSPPGERDEKGEWQPESWKPNPKRIVRR